VARITIEDCLRQIPNRFMLVNMVALRVRQIREGSEYLVSSPKNEDVVVSLREIAAGKLTLRPESDQADAETVEGMAALEAETVEGMAALEKVESMMAVNQDVEAGIESDERETDAKAKKEE